MLLDQCKFPLPLRLCLELLPFLPYAGLAFLAIPAFGFTGFYTVILLIAPWLWICCWPVCCG